MAETSKPRRRRRRLDGPAFAFYAALAVLVASLLAYVARFRGGIADDQSTWGQFGDYLAGIASAGVSFAALYLLYRTFLVQRAELRATKKALRDAAKSQNATARATRQLARASIKAARAQVRQLAIVGEQLVIQRAGTVPHFEVSSHKEIGSNGAPLLRISLKNLGALARAVEFVTDNIGGRTAHPERQDPTSVPPRGEWQMTVDITTLATSQSYEFVIRYKPANDPQTFLESWAVSFDGTRVRKSNLHTSLRR